MQKLKRRLIRVPALNRINLGLVILIAFLVLPGAWRTGIAFRAIPDQIDFATYYLAAAILNSDHPVLYREDLLYATASAKGVKDFAPPYVYPPLFAGILRPLASLPYDVAKAWWFVLNIGFLALSLFLLTRLAGFSVQLPWLTAGAILIGLFPPVHRALLLGQVSPLLLLLCTGSLYFAVELADRCGITEAIAGVFLALATMVKVFPALLLPYPLIMRRFRLTAWSMIGLLICLVLGVIWGGGVNNTLSYFGSFLPSLYGQRLDIVHPTNQSLSAFFMRLFTPATITVALLSKENQYIVKLTPLVNNRTLALAMTYMSSALILTATTIAVLQLSRKPFSKDRWALGFTLILMVPLLIISSAYYHLHVLFLLPLAILVRIGIKLNRPGVLTQALVVYLLTVVHRYSNWLAVLTSSAWLVSFGLYAALLLWGTLLYLVVSSEITGDAESERRAG